MCVYLDATHPVDTSSEPHHPKLVMAVNRGEETTQQPFLAACRDIIFSWAVQCLADRETRRASTPSAARPLSYLFSESRRGR